MGLLRHLYGAKQMHTTCAMTSIRLPAESCKQADWLTHLCNLQAVQPPVGTACTQYWHCDRRPPLLVASASNVHSVMGTLRIIHLA